ncbi:BA14K family protein [Chelativorans sp. AA-79]|uniref:BA14K family protein n=1 Tax=Chelativorans sp. AA-79 TaxID=3028735 RepID=UPI0023F927D2|nr:BA14K family protein [Chelativorans sp. AA-79]WEX07531.1 BA14K family protein [Chelativorans sp. AA-79]
MKYLLAFVSGFFLTGIVFVSGAALAVVYLTAEPVPVRPFYASASGPWTSEPVRVAANVEPAAKPSRADAPKAETAMQARFASRPRSDGIKAEQVIDPVTTASIAPEQSPRPVPSPAHIEWCSERYRSYDAADNMYNAYSGERRECVSPFSKTIERADFARKATSTTNASAEGSSADANEPFPGEDQRAYLEPEHVRSCFARYRSYRPEDNTYQPYGGGPRRQCE